MFTDLHAAPCVRVGDTHRLPCDVGVQAIRNIPRREISRRARNKLSTTSSQYWSVSHCRREKAHARKCLWKMLLRLGDVVAFGVAFGVEDVVAFGVEDVVVHAFPPGGIISPDGGRMWMSPPH